MGCSVQFIEQCKSMRAHLDAGRGAVLDIALVSTGMLWVMSVSVWLATWATGEHGLVAFGGLLVPLPTTTATSSRLAFAAHHTVPSAVADALSAHSANPAQ
jgi:hypothetical protein